MKKNITRDCHFSFPLNYGRYYFSIYHLEFPFLWNGFKVLAHRPDLVSPLMKLVENSLHKLKQTKGKLCRPASFDLWWTQPGVAVFFSGFSFVALQTVFLSTFCLPEFFLTVVYISLEIMYTFRNWSRLISKQKTCKTLWYSVEDCCNAKCINSLVFLGYRISFNKRPRSNKRSTLNKHLPPKAIYQTSAPFPSPLNFLNGRDTRRNCINCHFIENILRFHHSRIRTRGQFLNTRSLDWALFFQ